MISLCRTALDLPAGTASPGYDLNAVTPGIVHIGLGGFHRAHMARYTHDLMERDPTASQWGIIGAGLRESDVGLLDALSKQDGLYTLVERDGTSETRTVIGSIVATINASATSEALLKAIAQPATRIVSITVSEFGYHLDGPTKRLNLTSAAIQADLAQPHAPRTIPGILVEAYRRRRDSGARAFTALCCDNMPHNGKVLRGAVLAFAEKLDPALAAWIADQARFPNAMVDRITPVPTTAEITALAEETGINDRAALFAEAFRQWIIEDDFADGRPDWDHVGAQFVSDVAPYEAMKLRLLNASHLAIAGLGTLSGYETVGQTVADPLIRRYMARLMDAETGPTLKPVPGIDLAQYKATLIERFANPAIRDTNRRINIDAPLNLMLEPLRDRLAADQPIELLALGLAAWCQRVRNEAGDDGAGLSGNDREKLHGVWHMATGGGDVVAMLSIEPMFGSLGQEARLCAAVRYWLAAFAELGVTNTLIKAAEKNLF